MRFFFQLNRFSHFGFTLLEVLSVLVILAVLAVVAIPAYRSYVVKARVSSAASFLSFFEKKEMTSYVESDVFLDGDEADVPDGVEVVRYFRSSASCGGCTYQNLPNRTCFSVEFEPISGLNLARPTLAMVAIQDDDSITWVCKTCKPSLVDQSIPAEYLPSFCSNTGW